MAVRNRACNEQELIYLIIQALDKIFNLRAAIEYDEEYISDDATVIEPLNQGLTGILNSVKSGEHKPGEGDYLDFLNVLKNTDQRAIPFWTLLKLILDTHNDGYQGMQA